MLFRRRINQSRQHDLIILFILSLIFRVAMAAWASQPWYLDAAYYFDVAKNLARGHGFTEDFIFMYLTPAKNVVHPSNLYWMPLTSIIIAPFLALFGTNWHIAQFPYSCSLYRCHFLLTGSAGISFRVGAMHLPWPSSCLSEAIPTLYSLLLLIVLLCTAGSAYSHLWGCIRDGAVIHGALSWQASPIGLAHLTRADGILLLPVACLVWLCSQKKTRDDTTPWQSSQHTQLSPIPWHALLGMFCCYLLTMTPWFLRNIALVGSPLPTGGMTTIWLTNYADFFSFHKTISPQTYLSWGWKNILSSKVETLINHFLFLNEVTYIPFVFVIVGMWIERKRAELLPFLLYLIIMYSTLSLIFTIPSTHGTFFHSLVPLLPFLYAWAITGIDRTFASIRRHMYALKTGNIFVLLRVKGLVKFLNTAVHNASLLFLIIAMVIAIIVVGKTVLIVSARTSWILCSIRKWGRLWQMITEHIGCLMTLFNP